jgi:phage portal protein BeeE
MQLGGEAGNTTNIKGAGNKLLGLANRDREGKDNSKRLEQACFPAPALPTSAGKPIFLEGSSSVSYSQCLARLVSTTQSASSRGLL